MGRYVDWKDVTGRYADAAKIATGAEGMGSYWLNHAEAEVDGRLASMFNVPFTAPAPVTVQDLAIDLTYYKMTWRTEGAAKLKDYLDERFASIMAGQLALITASGTMLSPGDAGLALSNTADAESAFSMFDPVDWTMADSGSVGSLAGLP